MNERSLHSSLAGFEVVESNDRFDIGLDPSQAVMVMRRKPVGSFNAIDVVVMLRGVTPLMDDPAHWGVLFDSREAIGRSDSDFEHESRRMRTYLLETFARLAILVRSAAGVMQVRRLSTKLHDERLGVFRDPARARAFAAGRVRSNADPGS